MLFLVSSRRLGLNRTHRRGFTLVELLVVLAILSLLFAVVSPQVMKHLGRAKTQTAKMEVKNYGVVLDMFRIDVGRYPKQEEGLSSLAKKPDGLESWKGPYVEKQTSFIDPWGNAYIYRYPGQHGEYDLMSYGADEAEGGTGEDEDIINW